MHVQHVSSSPEPCARPPQQPPRKLCVRHQRMADEGTNLKLQQVCGLPGMTLILTGANSRWMSCRSRSGSRSTPSGRHSPRRLIPGALSSYRASSPCAAFPNFRFSPNSLLISSASTPLLSFPGKSLSKSWPTLMPPLSVERPRCLAAGAHSQTTMSFGEAFANNTLARNAQSAAGVSPSSRRNASSDFHLLRPCPVHPLLPPSHDHLYLRSQSPRPPLYPSQPLLCSNDLSLVIA